MATVDKSGNGGDSDEDDGDGDSQCKIDVFFEARCDLDPQLYVFRPNRERCPFPKILSRSRKFCSVRELDPIGKLASKYEFGTQLGSHTHNGSR